MSVNKMGEKPTVQYVRLGKAGLRVSVPIVGCMSFGSHECQDWVIDEDKAIELLKAAWDRGVTTLDTANVYSNGMSERIIAKFIKKYNIPREKLVIMSKCFFLVGEQLGTNTITNPLLANERDYVNQSGLSRGAIFNAVHSSLRRLETDYIDLLQIHRFDRNTPPEETMSALNDLVRSGKVRYIGASSMYAWQFSLYNQVAEKNGWTEFVSMQNHFNLLYREEEREMIPYCKYKGIGLIPYGPLSQGTLARPLDPSKHDHEKTSREETSVLKRVYNTTDREIISRVERLANTKNVSMAQIAIAWALTKVDSPIVGMSSPGRLEEAIPVGVSLTEEDIKYLEELYQSKNMQGPL
ncbi:Aldo/keto reductase [Dacryopinax primogenitus]|uniref:Aldo/keto reductase n=1 Tax=Dacryopinax primogenitus (strain DJM 731) TaxID=1858805 RepID=M5GEM0_DACPD|nr:Aldo/keto reductase [Dacryopinax primogenitus]EJU03383.1 Aldo/keto reductase [Dacryopinax primogenitus]